MKIAFDLGGVLSKYPQLIILLQVLRDANFYRQDYSGASGAVEVFVLSDMHPREKIIDQLRANGLGWVPADHVISADYQAHGEACKAVACKELGIDILVDDFIGYVAVEGAPVRLLVMPDATKPYYHDDWKTDGTEGDFGRRKFVPKP